MAEKFFSEDGKTTTYTNKAGEEIVKFSNDEKRLFCIHSILAFYSYDICQIMESKKGQFLYVEFNGDQEIYDTMMNPTNFKLTWKDLDKTSELAPYIEDIDENLTRVVLKVTKLNEDDVLFFNSFDISPIHLFSNFRLPWTIENKNQEQIVVYLSSLHREVLQNEKNKLKIKFYQIENNNEAIIEQEQKLEILSKIIENIPKDESNKNNILTLTFKNGHLDLISAVSKTIMYKFYEFKPLEDLKDEKVEGSSVLVIFYINNTDKILEKFILNLKE